jgi:hypothetical protein
MSLSEEEKKERKREYDKAYYAANADKQRERKRQYSKAYRVANPDKERERQKIYYVENRDKIREGKKIYYAANCDKARKSRKKWYDVNPDKAREFSKKYREAIADKMKNGDIPIWAKCRINAIKFKCTKNGIPFDLDVEYLVSIYPKDGKCPVFGTPLIIGDKINCPSIDRIIPSKGYKKGNVRIISNTANTLKSNATLEQLIMLGDDAKKYIDHLDSDLEEQPWL